VPQKRSASWTAVPIPCTIQRELTRIQLVLAWETPLGRQLNSSASWIAQRRMTHLSTHKEPTIPANAVVWEMLTGVPQKRSASWTAVPIPCTIQRELTRIQLVLAWETPLGRQLNSSASWIAQRRMTHLSTHKEPTIPANAVVWEMLTGVPQKRSASWTAVPIPCTIQRELTRIQLVLAWETPLGRQLNSSASWIAQRRMTHLSTHKEPTIPANAVVWEMLTGVPQKRSASWTAVPIPCTIQRELTRIQLVLAWETPLGRQLNSSASWIAQRRMTHLSTHKEPTIPANAVVWEMLTGVPQKRSASWTAVPIPCTIQRELTRIQLVLAWETPLGRQLNSSASWIAQRRMTHLSTHKEPTIPANAVVWEMLTGVPQKRSASWTAVPIPCTIQRELTRIQLVLAWETPLGRQLNSSASWIAQRRMTHLSTHKEPTIPANAVVWEMLTGVPQKRSASWTAVPIPCTIQRELTRIQLVLAWETPLGRQLNSSASWIAQRRMTHLSTHKEPTIPANAVVWEMLTGVPQKRSASWTAVPIPCTIQRELTRIQLVLAWETPLGRQLNSSASWIAQRRMTHLSTHKEPTIPANAVVWEMLTGVPQKRSASWTAVPIPCTIQRELTRIQLVLAWETPLGRQLNSSASWIAQRRMTHLSTHKEPTIPANAVVWEMLTGVPQKRSASWTAVPIPCTIQRELTRIQLVLAWETPLGRQLNSSASWIAQRRMTHLSTHKEPTIPANAVVWEMLTGVPQKRSASWTAVPIPCTIQRELTRIQLVLAWETPLGRQLNSSASWIAQRRMTHLSTHKEPTIPANAVVWEMLTGVPQKRSASWTAVPIPCTIQRELTRIQLVLAWETPLGRQLNSSASWIAQRRMTHLSTHKEPTIPANAVVWEMLTGVPQKRSASWTAVPIPCTIQRELTRIQLVLAWETPLGRQLNSSASWIAQRRMTHLSTHKEPTIPANAVVWEMLTGVPQKRSASWTAVPIPCTIQRELTRIQLVLAWETPLGRQLELLKYLTTQLKCVLDCTKENDPLVNP
jgi:hypothetical protein